MSEKYIKKLVGRTIEAAYCERCGTFQPILMPVNGVGTPRECPVCNTLRVRCDITIEHTEI